MLYILVGSLNAPVTSQETQGILILHLAEFKYTPRRNTPGNDIDCNQKDRDKAVSYCKTCNVIDLVDACSRNDQ